MTTEVSGSILRPGAPRMQIDARVRDGTSAVELQLNNLHEWVEFPSLRAGVPRRAVWSP